MRRTLTVLVASAALMVPATAASAASTSNASCNSGKQVAGGVFNDKGNARGGCKAVVPVPALAPVIYE